MSASRHIGKNIRNIRLLKDMKQQAFAQELGIKQQNVSKMENSKNVSQEKLKKAAEVLGVTIETIEKFNEKVLFNNNIALEQNSGQIVNPIKEVIEYFKGELMEKDNQLKRKNKEIEKLKKELDKYSKESELANSNQNLHTISMQSKKKNLKR